MEAYDLAQARAVYARAEWAKAGSPLQFTHGNGVVGPHQLWKALLEAESFALRCRSALKASARAGRPVGAQSAPDRGVPSKRSRLRVAS